jgi:RES domain-containing protein
MTDQRSLATGVVFRIDNSEHDDLARTVEASRKEPGRFNTSDFGAVYVSREPDTAIGEFRRNNEKLERACALFVISLSAATIIDLSNPDERQRWHLSLEDLTSDDLSRCRQAAESAIRAGVEAIIWPSAAGGGHSLAVFAGRLQAGSRVEILHAIELTDNVIASVEAGVPIARIHPLISTFPSFG